GYLMNKATLIDSYGNEITFPDYKNYYYFYYSKLITSIKKDEVKNNSFSLLQNYPNPFNPATTITYSLSKNSFVTLKIYDLLGREVTTLVNEEKHSGNYKITWNAQNFPSGVYFYKITASEFSKVNKMILLK
ncbi:MAG: T9SS type A sorting domain-containing protein, partial [Candidatus Thorarchaeota archaeon]